MGDKKTTQQIIVSGLIENAIQHFTKAIEELATGSSTYALISYYTGIELVIKARLASEHWALIAVNPAKADIDAFIDGECNTVGFKEAADRLKNICKDTPPDTLSEMCNGLRQHRNRLVHFYHPDSENNSLRQKIAAEICQTWFPLHTLVATRWREYFKYHQNKFSTLDYSMRKIGLYLKTRYNDLQSKLGRMEADGMTIIDCYGCGYKAMVSDPSEMPMRIYNCLVCHSANWRVVVSCTNHECTGSAEVNSYSGAECNKCGHVLDLGTLVDLLTPSYKPQDGDVANRAYCSECQNTDLGTGTGTVVPFDIGAEEYICINCLEIYAYDSVDCCDFCGEMQTNLPEASWHFGCMICDGHSS